MRHALFKSFRIRHDVGVQDSQNLKGQQLAIVNNYNNSIKSTILLGHKGS